MKKVLGLGLIYMIGMHMFACLKTLPDFNLADPQFKIILLGMSRQLPAQLFLDPSLEVLF